jgi:hypothetical protein
LESLGLLKQEDKTFELNIINTNFKHLLSEEIKMDLKSRTIPKSTSIKEMLKNSTKHNAVLVEAYKEYYILSKVEHTGEFTRMILEKTYTSEVENPMDSHLSNAIYLTECTIKSIAPFFLNNFNSFRIIDR